MIFIDLTKTLSLQWIYSKVFFTYWVFFLIFFIPSPASIPSSPHKEKKFASTRNLHTSVYLPLLLSVWQNMDSDFILFRTETYPFLFWEVYPCRNYFSEQNDPKSKFARKILFNFYQCFFLIPKKQNRKSIIKKTSERN